MPDWLRDTVDSGDVLPPVAVLAGRLALAVALGFAVAGVYRMSHGRHRGDARTLPTTLVLLSALIALVTLVIGNSVARAFGLVGALSIVRFRTVVEDTRDTAFVIFAVVVGMAAGAGYGVLAGVGVPVVAAAAVAMTRLTGPRGRAAGRAATLAVRLGTGFDPDAVLGPVFAKHLAHARLTGVATAKQGAALELTYAVRLRDPAATVPLVAELNRTEGVQGVELREVASSAG